VKKYDDALELIYRKSGGLSDDATRQRHEAEQLLAHEYQRGLISRDDLFDIQDEINYYDHLALEYTLREIRALQTARRRRAFVRCRTRRLVPPVVEAPTNGLPVVHDTEVRALSSLDSFSLSESGPHAPPCLVGGPP